MTAAKTYPKRFNAQRAARAALKNPEAAEGKDFVTAKNRFGQWDFVTMDAVKKLTAVNKAADAAADRCRFAEVAADEARLHAPQRAAKAAKPAKALGQRAQIEADAAAGKLPTPPDFSAETHARFRKRLAEIVGFAGAGDIKALKADTTEPKSSSRIALCRYRDLCIVALEARAAGKAAA